MFVNEVASSTECTPGSGIMALSFFKASEATLGTFKI